MTRKSSPSLNSSNNAMPNLPGVPLPGAPTPPTPALPGAGAQMPTPEQQIALSAYFEALKAKTLAELVLLVNAHPEWIAWARASVAGTMQFNTPPKPPAS